MACGGVLKWSHTASVLIIFCMIAQVVATCVLCCICYHGSYNICVAVSLDTTLRQRTPLFVYWVMAINPFNTLATG